MVATRPNSGALMVGDPVNEQAMVDAVAGAPEEAGASGVSCGDLAKRVAGAHSAGPRLDLRLGSILVFVHHGGLALVSGVVALLGIHGAVVWKTLVLPLVVEL